MYEQLKNIAQNTAATFFIEAANKFFLFVLIIYAARALGVKTFGDFSYALTLYVLLQMFADFGFNIYLTRKIAQEPAEKDKIFFVSLRFRTVHTVIMLLLFIFYLHFLKDSADVKIFVFITGASLVISSYAYNFILTLRGLQMIKADGFIRLCGSFSTIVLSLGFLKAGMGIIGVAFSIFAGNMVMMLVAIKKNRKHQIICNVKGRIKPADYSYLIKGTLPFMALTITANIFGRIDTLLLRHLKGPVDVGLYHSSLKIMEALLIFQSAFALVMLPVLSLHQAKNDVETLKFFTQLGVKYMAYAGMFFSIVTFMTADKIIEILYFSSEYAGAIKGLQILVFVNLTLFLSTPVGALILSSRYAHMVLGLHIFMAAMSVTLNFLLIPGMGFVGTSLARLATELSGLIISVIFINKYLFKIRFLKELTISFFAGIPMAIMIYFVKSLLFVPLYFVVYVIVIYLLGGISTSEFVFVKDIVTGRLKRS